MKRSGFLQRLGLVLGLPLIFIPKSKKKVVRTVIRREKSGKWDSSNRVVRIETHEDGSWTTYCIVDGKDMKGWSFFTERYNG